MEKFFEEGELSREEIISGLNNGILGGDITPVCCCAAQPNIGVCTLMDNLVKYMPPASMAKAPKAVNPKTGDAVEVKQDGKIILFIRTASLRLRSSRPLLTSSASIPYLKYTAAFSAQMLLRTIPVKRSPRSPLPLALCAARRSLPSISSSLAI